MSKGKAKGLTRAKAKQEGQAKRLREVLRAKGKQSRRIASNESKASKRSRAKKRIDCRASRAKAENPQRARLDKIGRADILYNIGIKKLCQWKILKRKSKC